MAIEAIVDGNPAIIADVAGVSAPSAGSSNAVYIKGDKGDPGEAATIAVGETTTLPPGSDATVTNSGTSSNAVFDFGLPAGADGQDGQDGQDGTDGVSPTIESEAITGGHRLTITDAGGVSTVDVMDGIDGEDGTDGVSPTVSSEAITGGHRLTITDAQGTTTVDVMDGQDGQGTPATADPLMDGTAAVGVSDKYAREDHVHPTDTSRVSTSGDTMTGSLAISGGRITTKSTDIDTDTTPSAYTWGTGQIRFEDKDNDPIALFVPAKTTANQQGLVLGARRSVSGSLIDNLLYFYIDGSGNRIITVSNAAPWRSALNAVDKAGDTMTGNFNVKSSDLDRSVTPSSSNKYGAVRLRFADKNGLTVGGACGANMVDGSSGIRMYAVNAAGAENGLNITIDSSGNKKVTITEGAPWRATLGLGTNGVLPITIAQGGTGQTGTSIETTVSNVISAASGTTITAVTMKKWGKVVMLYMRFKVSSALSSSAETTIGTLTTAWRPAVATHVGGSFSSYCEGYLSSGGGVIVHGTLPANTETTIFATYLLA